MANVLGSLIVELLAETGAFTSGMSKAGYTARQTAKDIQGAFGQIGGAVQGALGQFGQLGGVLSNLGSHMSELFSSFSAAGSSMGAAIGALGGVAAAGVAAAAGLAALAVEGAEVVERLDLISEKTGISIRDLQTFEAAGRTVGVSLEDMVTAMRKFDQSLTNTGKGSAVAQAVLKSLGVTSHDNKEAILEVADAFSKMPDGAVKASDAIALFGRSGLAMIPLLNKGRDGFAEAAKAIDQYGATISGKALAANEAWRKSTENLSLAWDSLKVNLTESVLPAVSSVVTKIADLTKVTGDVISEFVKHTGQSLAALATGGPESLVVNAELSQTIDKGSTSKQAAAQELAKKSTDALIAKQQQLFEIEKAGGTAAYELEQKKLDLTAAIDSEHYDIALQIQKQIEGLEAAAELEKQRLELYREFVKEQQKQFFKGKGDIKEGHKSFQAPELTPELQSIGGPSSAQIAQASQAALSTKSLDNFSAKIADLYREWGVDAEDNAASIKATYDTENAELVDSFRAVMADKKTELDKGLIDQQTYNDKVKALNDQLNAALVESDKARQKALQALPENADSFSTQFQTFFQKIQSGTKDITKSFFDDMSSALDSLNSQIAKFAVTGKANFKQIAASLEENVTQKGLKVTEGLAATGLNKLFPGLGGLLPGGKGKRGDTPTNPIYTSAVDSSGNILDPSSFLKTGALGAYHDAFMEGDTPIANLFGGGGSESLTAQDLAPLTNTMAKTADGLGSSIDGLFSSISSFFGGFLAGGGDVTPGKAYVVGEKHSEWFLPKTPGTVVPTLRLSNAPASITNEVHFHGVTDMDSFKRSQSQLMAQFHSAASLAYARSR